MPGWTMINGVWREMWDSTSAIRGVTRYDNIYCNINNVVRTIHEHEFNENSIIGFKLIYKRSSVIRHTQLHHLVNNPNLPTRADPTGDLPHEMSLGEKGILFQYTAEKPSEEGLSVYEGYLFGILVNGELVDVTRSKPDVGSDERFDTGIPGYNSVWLTSRVSTLDIQIIAREWYQSFGLYTFGWNSFFTTENFLNPHNYPEKGPVIDNRRIERWPLMPHDYRERTFSPVARIGIARDMHTDFTHMIGSSGSISQSLGQVTVNGVPKPFVVEVYE